MVPQRNKQLSSYLKELSRFSQKGAYLEYMEHNMSPQGQGSTKYVFNSHRARFLFFFFEKQGCLTIVKYLRVH